MPYLEQSWITLSEGRMIKERGYSFKKNRQLNMLLKFRSQVS